MRARSGKLLFPILLPCFAACSLFVSLDDLQDSDASVGPDGGGSVDAPADVALDSPIGRDGGTDAGPDTSVFVDTFDRPDDDAIGNGWLEKSPASFAIVNDTAARTSERNLDFVDNIFYRPASENVADTEVSVDFTFANDAGGYPQVHARVQTDTVTLSDTLDSYLLYVEDAFTANIARERGNENLVGLQTLALTQTLAVGPTYRVRMRITGAHPVHVTGWVEIQSGSAWNVIGFAEVDDDDPTQLADAGSVGMTGSNGDVAYVYDNFSRTNL